LPLLSIRRENLPVAGAGVCRAARAP